MEMFDAHRRDILNFDNYMDLKKPGFGGPKSAIALKDGRGKLVNDNPKLDGYRRTVERDPAFSHPVYDPTYKAMTHDLVYKQEKKKPFTYDHTRTGIPVVEIEPVDEGKTYTSFTRFINEMDDYFEDDEDEDNFEDNFRASATRSNSNLSQIEDKLRGFETDEYGSNPYAEEEYEDYPFENDDELPHDLGDYQEEDYESDY